MNCNFPLISLDINAWRTEYALRIFFTLHYYSFVYSSWIWSTLYSFITSQIEWGCITPSKYLIETFIWKKRTMSCISYKQNIELKKNPTILYFHLEHRYTRKMKVPLSVNDPFDKFIKVSYETKDYFKYTKLKIQSTIFHHWNQEYAQIS